MSTPAAPTDVTYSPHWRRHIALFLGAQAISLFGSAIVQYALIWYLALEYKSGLTYTIGMIFAMLPQGFITVFAGVWADRHNRKYLIMGADAAIALVCVGLAFALMGGIDPIIAILVALALRSLGAGVQMPAVSALIAQVVPTEKLLRVNGINNTLQPLIFLVAPALAAFLYTLLPLSYLFFIDVAGAIIAITLTGLIPVAKITRSGAAATGYFHDLRDGLRYLARRPDLRRIGYFLIASLVLFFPAANLLPILLVRDYGGETWKLATVEMLWSIGMMVGGAIIAAVGQIEHRWRFMIISTLASCGFTVFLGLADSFWLVVVITGVFGLVMPFFSTVGLTTMQETVEGEYQGRVMSLAMLAMAVGGPIGMLFAGPLSDAIPVTTVFIICGGLGLIVTALLSRGLPPFAARVNAEPPTPPTGEEGASEASVVR